MHSSRPRLAIVSRERIEAELRKLLELPRPSAGVSFLVETGLLGDVLPPWQHAAVAVPAEALDDIALVDAYLEDPVALRWAILLGPGVRRRSCRGALAVRAALHQLDDPQGRRDPPGVSVARDGCR